MIHRSYCVPHALCMLTKILFGRMPLFTYFCVAVKANLAQLVEQLIRNEQAVGSNPMVGSVLEPR